MSVSSFEDSSHFFEKFNTWSFISFQLNTITCISMYCNSVNDGFIVALLAIIYYFSLQTG